MIKQTKVLLVDVDGCLTKGRSYCFDVDGVKDLIDACELKNITLILASGRSQPYLEALSQILCITTPYICENGAGVYDPVKNSYIHTSATGSLEDVKSSLDNLEGYTAIYEPGKEFSLSFRLKCEVGESDIGLEYKTVIDNVVLPGDLSITHSSSAIDIIPANVSKGIGAQIVANRLGCNLHDFAGFGDSMNDASFLTMVGYSGAPSNACIEIKEMVHYVSGFEDIKGLVDFVRLPALG